MLSTRSPRGVAPPVRDDCAPIGNTRSASLTSAATSASFRGNATPAAKPPATCAASPRNDETIAGSSSTRGGDTSRARRAMIRCMSVCPYTVDEPPRAQSPKPRDQSPEPTAHGSDPLHIDLSLTTHALRPHPSRDPERWPRERRVVDGGLDAGFISRPRVRTSCRSRDRGNGGRQRAACREDHEKSLACVYPSTALGPGRRGVHGDRVVPRLRP